MKNRFFNLAFGLLFVHQLGRFIFSLSDFFEDHAVEERSINIPDVKDDMRLPLSQFDGASSENEREQRKVNLEAACSSSSSAKSLKSLTSKQREVLLKHVIVSEKYKFLYCYVPKVACSNWKRVVMVLDGISADFVKDHPHGFAYLSEYSAAEIDEKLTTYYKFAFVRNPLERLLSAYRNKFGEIEDVMRTYGVKIKKKYGSYKEEEYDGKIPGDDVSFDEFIRYLIDQPAPESMNEHWAPMNTLCRPCIMDYDFVGSYDNLYEDSEAILKEIKAPPKLHFPARQSFYSPTNYATIAYFYSLLNSTNLEKLLSKYSKDFTLFSYPFPKVKSSSSLYEHKHLVPMKLRHLESHLEDVEGFESPKLSLEQYVTRPHIAACMVHTAESQYGDITGRVVADLGCGCGVLSIAAVMMECDFCIGVDVDRDALDICSGNCSRLGIENMDRILADVNDVAGTFRNKRFVDSVIMNPPFGTKKNQGIDMKFLEVASKIASRCIYSLHKTSTRAHVLRKAKEFGLQGEVVAELRYDLPASYKFHKVKTKDIEVDFFRFSFK